MKAVVQAVTRASVSVEGALISEIGKGLCILVGVMRDDTVDDIHKLIKRILNTRFFADANGNKWKCTVRDNNYDILCVSQFTLCSQFNGNKLTFHRAMAPQLSKVFYDQFMSELRTAYDATKIHDGVFGANMSVLIENGGPVTISIDTREQVVKAVDTVEREESQQN